LPDVISSDVHALCVDGPAYDLLVTMSKFLALGMPLEDVIRTATWEPAKAMGRSDLGTFAVDALGDASVLELRAGQYRHVDCIGEHLSASEHLFCDGIVVGGAWWPGEGGAA
jgi:dihydroorotase